MECEVQASISALKCDWADGAQISTLLRSTWDHSLLCNRAKNEDVKAILALINSWLKDEEKLVDGLQVLHKVVAQSSGSVLTENLGTWFQQATRALDRGAGGSVRGRSLALAILRNLIRKSADFQQWNKTVSGTVLPPIMETLKDPSVRIHALGCLLACLRYYGGCCGTHKGAIEQRLVDVLPLGGEEEVLLAGNCMAWLPLAGGGGTGQTGHQAAWRLLQLRLIGSLHLDMDALFEGISELPMVVAVDNTLCLRLPNLTETRPVARLQQLQRRIIGLCSYLGCLIAEPMSLVKNVLVREVLQVVCRGLSVTGLSLGSSPTLERQVLRDLLPCLHCHLLELLNALTATLGKNLLPFLPVVYKLIIGTLKWTKANKQAVGLAKPHSCLRRAAYQSLRVCLAANLELSGVHCFVDELLPLALPDITPDREVIALKCTKGKHKKQKSSNQESDASASKPPPDQTALKSNSALCAAALAALSAVLQSAGCLLQPDHHKVLQGLSVPLGLELMRGGVPHPLYQEPQCQGALLQLLLALVLNPHPQVTPPTTWALNIFSAGQRHANKKVSALSQQALVMCGHLAHPMTPCLVPWSPPEDSQPPQLLARSEAAPRPPAQSDDTAEIIEEVDLAVEDTVPDDGEEDEDDIAIIQATVRQDLACLSDSAVQVRVDGEIQALSSNSVEDVHETRDAESSQSESEIIVDSCNGAAEEPEQESDNDVMEVEETTNKDVNPDSNPELAEMLSDFVDEPAT